MSFTKANVQKIFDYISNNREELIQKQSVSTAPAYPNNKTMADYLWYIVDIPNLGELRFYHTASSTVLKINNVHAGCLSEFKNREYETAYAVVEEISQKITINKASNWFDKH